MKKSAIQWLSSMRLVILASLVTAASVHVNAGSFIFSSGFPNVVTHPSNYSGTGGQVDVNVCIVPGTPNASAMEQPIRNNIAVWNRQQSTTSNLRNIALPSNTFDFESVALHELGHCVGLGHPNLGFQSGVSGSNTEFTQSSSGPDGLFGFGAGVDSIIGSADDVRGDDVNLHYFNPGINNPFAESKIIDSTTYTRDLSMLPVGDLFPANGSRFVSSLARYKAPFSEASMQQGTFNDEIQRTLSHDDVSTLRFGRSGLDRIQNTADDYTINLTYGGISNSNCDINVAMDATQTGFAVCKTSASFLVSNSHLTLTQANVFFDPNTDWYFNTSAPCSASVALQPAVWKMISLPCQVGISTLATVDSVFADDLGTTNYDVDWVVFNYVYADLGNGNFSGSYQKLSLSDELENGKGYWIITNESDKTVDVQGEYNSQVDSDVFVDTDNMNNYGWNMVGMPFRFPVAWADTGIVDTNGDLLTLTEADPVTAGGLDPTGSGSECTDTTPPAAGCKVAQFSFIYNGSTGMYDIMGITAGTLNSFDAAWVFAGGPDYSVRFPMPAAERTTP